MKIHYNTLTLRDIWTAARYAGVSIERDKYTGSTSHNGKVDIILSGSSTYNVNFSTMDVKAATWDEWGIFLNQLFMKDPTIVAGPYTSGELFHAITQNRFMYLKPENQHKRHKWEFAAPSEFHCECGAGSLNPWHFAIAEIQNADKRKIAELRKQKKIAKHLAKVGK